MSASVHILEVLREVIHPDDVGLIQRQSDHSLGRTVEGVSTEDGELFSIPIGELDGVSSDGATEGTVILGIVGGEVECKVLGESASSESSESEERGEFHREGCLVDVMYSVNLP